MPTREELERERKERENAEIIARDSLINDGTYYLPEIPNYDSKDIVDVDSKFIYPVQNTAPKSLDDVVDIDEVPELEEKEPLDEKEKFIAEVYSKKFAEFLESEKSEVEYAVAQIKQEHPQDYEEYINELRQSPYYQQCLDKWKKYYEDQKEKFVDEARKEAETMDSQARLDAAPEEEVVEVAPKSVEKKQAPKAKPVVSKPAEKDPAKTDVKMKADAGLKETIEQILLVNLQDAIDENRDYYDLMQKAKKNPAWKEVVGTRADFARALVQAYAKTFDLTKNHTKRSPYSKTIREMQSDIASKQGSMDMKTVGYSVMDSFYHYDLKTKEATGMIPDLAEHLAVQVQEKLVNNGQLDFNLCKEAAEKMLEEIANESAVSISIAQDNKSEFKYLKFVDELNKLFTTISSDMNSNRESTVSFKNLGQIERVVKGIKEQADVVGEIACDEILRASSKIRVLAVKAENARRNGNEAEKSALTKEINEEKKRLSTLITPEKEIDKKSGEKYWENNVGKKTGTRSIIDKMLIEATKRVGATRSLGQLETFTMPKSVVKEETEKLLDYIDKNRNATIDVTYDMLARMNLLLHDVREKFKEDEAKYDKVQAIMDEVFITMEAVDSVEEEELPKEVGKKVSSIFNQFIDVSQWKLKGEQRLKVGLDFDLKVA